MEILESLHVVDFDRIDLSARAGQEQDASHGWRRRKSLHAWVSGNDCNKDAMTLVRRFSAPFRSNSTTPPATWDGHMGRKALG
jgi:hypothetical protein